MKKSPEAFRTIGEVSVWLDTPAYVLRFWEGRFHQIKPRKHLGNRRYYRPKDMQLIGGIKTLLHREGMTIKAVQALLKERGAKHVAAFSIPLEAGVVASEPSVSTSIIFSSAGNKTVQAAELEQAASARDLGFGNAPAKTDKPGDSPAAPCQLEFFKLKAELTKIGSKPLDAARIQALSELKELRARIAERLP